MVKSQNNYKKFLTRTINRKNNSKKVKDQIESHNFLSFVVLNFHSCDLVLHVLQKNMSISLSRNGIFNHSLSVFIKTAEINGLIPKYCK